MIIEKTMGFWERANKGDIDAIVCTTNNVIKNDGSLVMGAGIALAFNKEFPYLAQRWGKVIEGMAEGGHTDYGVVIDGPRSFGHNQIYLVGVQTKRHWGDPSPIELVVESVSKLAYLADLLCWTRVICPAFGCSNGQLEWPEVEKKIKKILDDRFIIIGLSPDGTAII
jgi:hypothetical protein